MGVNYSYLGQHTNALAETREAFHLDPKQLSVYIPETQKWVIYFFHRYLLEDTFGFIYALRIEAKNAQVYSRRYCARDS